MRQCIIPCLNKHEIVLISHPHLNIIFNFKTKFSCCFFNYSNYVSFHKNCFFFWNDPEFYLLQFSIGKRIFLSNLWLFKPIVEQWVLASFSAVASLYHLPRLSWLPHFLELMAIVFIVSMRLGPESFCHIDLALWAPKEWWKMSGFAKTFLSSSFKDFF